jgi:hypothetical protein
LLAAAKGNSNPEIIALLLRAGAGHVVHPHDPARAIGDADPPPGVNRDASWLLEPARSVAALAEGDQAGSGDVVPAHDPAVGVIGEMHPAAVVRRDTVGSTGADRPSAGKPLLVPPFATYHT